MRGEDRTEPFLLYSFEKWAKTIPDKYQIGCIAFVITDEENRLLDGTAGLSGWSAEDLPAYGRFVREWYRTRSGPDQ